MVSYAQPLRGAGLVERYDEIRALTVKLCQPLAIEDYGVQSIPEASPPKWHLAHTSWFFETFILRPGLSDYQSIDERYQAFFNSYYVSVSELVPQASRGTFSRPTVEEVFAYRQHVDRAMRRWLESSPNAEQKHVFEVGLQHEQQHQELLLMDIKSHLLQPPFFPVYSDAIRAAGDVGSTGELTWTAFDERLVQVGYSGSGYCWDNEHPRHSVFLHSFELADRPITNGEWLEFIASGGYETADHWLSDGWAAVRAGTLRAPMYWFQEDGEWMRFGLGGARPVERSMPVCHVSYYEADAYARWRGARLPTEQEWEYAASQFGDRLPGVFLEDEYLDPVLPSGTGMRALAGGVWEWTSSDYAPYPGYSKPDSALGEYNGKFMVNQRVLRGGSCATPRSHYRHSYRNFFYPHQRWPFTGVRLAR